MNTKTTLLICLLILLVGAGTTAAIFMSEPDAERSGAVRDNAMLVDVIGVTRGTYRPDIQVMGTVEPAADIMLSPQVGGQVVRLNTAFEPGGIVRSGQVLLQIDRADYENVLAQRKSDLSEALAELNIEQGRHQVAQQDFALLGDSIVTGDRSLVLREPQLQAAMARVEAARAAVKQAELNLERTTIRAPFDAHILSRAVNVGSQVTQGETLGRIVGRELYWVVGTIPQAQLRWLTFPGQGVTPSPVLLRNRTAWEPGVVREGILHSLVGALEDQTRLARIIIDVSDPMAVLPQNIGAPPLMIGSFVEASIEGKVLNDVVRLQRDYVRKNDTVWIMEDGTLRIRPVDILFQDANYAYITEGLNDGEQVVISNLSTVSDGAPLRLDDAGDTATLPEAKTVGN